MYIDQQKQYPRAHFCGWTCPTCCIESGIEEDRFLPLYHKQLCEDCHEVFVHLKNMVVNMTTGEIVLDGR